MTELKMIKKELFRATLTNHRLAGEAIDTLGNDDSTTIYFRNRFNALYDLICVCGLREDYEAWKAQQPEDKDV